jgi:hypothetical protein
MLSTLLLPGLGLLYPKPAGILADNGEVVCSCSKILTSE